MQLVAAGHPNQSTPPPSLLVLNLTFAGAMALAPADMPAMVIETVEVPEYPEQEAPVRVKMAL